MYKKQSIIYIVIYLIAIYVICVNEIDDHSIIAEIMIASGLVILMSIKSAVRIIIESIHEHMDEI